MRTLAAEEVVNRVRDECYILGIQCSEFGLMILEEYKAHHTAQRLLTFSAFFFGGGGGYNGSMNFVYHHDYDSFPGSCTIYPSLLSSRSYLENVFHFFSSQFVLPQFGLTIFCCETVSFSNSIQLLLNILTKLDLHLFHFHFPNLLTHNIRNVYN